MNISLLKDSIEYIRCWVEFHFNSNQFPGASFCISYKGKILLYEQFGFAELSSKEPLNNKHAFRVASQSKMFTAVAIMQMQEKGLLKIDDTVQKYLPWFGQGKEKSLTEITIRQLLSHNSGLTRDGANCDYWQQIGHFPKQDRFRKEVESSPLVFENNTFFKYSNFGFGLLGLIIEEISSNTYNDHINKNIFAPSGMTNSGADWDIESKQKIAYGYTPHYHKRPRIKFKTMDTGVLSPATGAYSTPKDMSKFAAALSFGSGKLLNNESKKEMFKVQSTSINASEGFYGLGIKIEDIGNRRLVGHAGGFPGYISKTLFDPNGGLSVSLSGNSLDFPSVAMMNGIFKIIDFYQNNAGDKKPSKKLEKFTGRFYSLWGTRDIVKIGSKVFMAIPGMLNPFDSSIPLTYKDSKNLTIGKVSNFNPVGETVSYEFDATKKVKVIRIGGMSFFPWHIFKQKFLKKSRNQSL